MFYITGFRLPTRFSIDYLNDALGSVIGLVDANSHVSVKNKYDEFGVPKPAKKFDQNWPGSGNAFGYTGLQYDYYAGLNYARARYYMPEIGRFIAEDTYEGNITNPLSLNLYTYVQNNPLIYIDPSGHSPLGMNWQEGMPGYESREALIDLNAIGEGIKKGIYYPSRKALKEIAVPIARKRFGKYTADFLDHALQSNPSDLRYKSSSDLSKLIKGDEDYKKVINDLIDNANKNKLTSFSESTSFAFSSNRDLKNAFHNVNIQANGKLEGNTWNTIVKITDDYKF